LFVADSQNSRIRHIDPAGVVTTVAGIGGQGFVVGSGGEAQFSLPSGIAIAPNGTVYVTDYNLHRIFKLVDEAGS
jgi:sugar lactone lactonase YvrE